MGIISTMQQSRFYQRIWKILALTTGKCWALIDINKLLMNGERTYCMCGRCVNILTSDENRKVFGIEYVPEFQTKFNQSPAA